MTAMPVMHATVPCWGRLGEPLCGEHERWKKQEHPVEANKDACRGWKTASKAWSRFLQQGHDYLRLGTLTFDLSRPRSQLPTGRGRTKTDDCLERPDDDVRQREGSFPDGK
jgi:hypothetical protein